MREKGLFGNQRRTAVPRFPLDLLERLTAVHLARMH